VQFTRKMKNRKLRVDLKWADFRLSPIKYFKEYDATILEIAYKAKDFSNYILKVSLIDVIKKEKGKGKKHHRCNLCGGIREVAYISSPQFGFGYLCRRCRETYDIKRIINKKLKKK